MNLIVQYYDSHNATRQKELNTALNLNIQNEYITRIYLFLEHDVVPLFALKNKKVTIIHLKKRVTWNYVFKYINKTIPVNEMVIVCNSDISFDKSLKKINKVDDMSNRVFALLRYEILPDFSLELFGLNDTHPCYHPNILYGASQDSWIFQSPVKQEVFNVDSDFFIGGVHLCDSKINWVFHQAGYAVTNPCLSIRSLHHHKDNNVRSRYIQELGPPYYSPIPATLTKQSCLNIKEGGINEEIVMDK